jgi:phage gpG-like protein
MLTIAGLASKLKIAPQVLPQAVKEAGAEIEMIAVSQMKKDMTASVSPDGTPYKPLRYPRPRGGNKPLLDRGILRANLAAVATADDLTLVSRVPGSRVHQWGATIVPVNKKFLAIPMTKQALYAGSPLNFPGLFFVPGGLASRDNVQGRRGKYGTRVSQKVTLHYRLVKKVVVPARPYLGLSKEATELISYAIARQAMQIFLEKFNQ